MALFESYERREKQILDVLAQYDIKSIEECREICQAKGFDPYKIVEGIQPICFENAKWAYTVGCAIALKKGVKSAAEAAAAIGEGLQSFCIPGSVADQRKVGLGHGNLGKGLRSQVGTMYGTLAKGPRYLEMTDGYVTGIALDADNEIIGYKFVNFGKMMDFIKAGDDANTAFEKAQGQYGRVDDAVKIIDPRKE